MLWFSLSESKVYATTLGITIPQYFVHPSNKLLDRFAHGGKTINVSFEEFKGKDNFFVRE